MISKFQILTTRMVPNENIVKAIVLPRDKQLWPELRQNVINFRIDPTDPVLPHRGIVYVAFFGNYFGTGNDNTLTVSMWRQF